MMKEHMYLLYLNILLNSMYRTGVISTRGYYFLREISVGTIQEFAK